MRIVACGVNKMGLFGMCCVVALVFCSPALGTPVSGNDNENSMLVQVTPISEHDSAVLESLKIILAPLRKDIASRTRMVEKLKAVETDPIAKQLIALNEALREIKQQIGAAQTKIDGVPEQRKYLELMRDSNNASTIVLDEELQHTISVGEAQLNILQATITQVVTDEKVIQKLLEWLDQAARNWDGTGSLEQLKAVANTDSGSSQSDEMKKLLSFIQTRDSYGTTPTEIRDYVLEVSETMKSMQSESQQVYTNLTLTLNKQRDVLDGKIIEARDAVRLAETQLKELEIEEKTLLVDLGTHNASLEETVENQKILQKNLEVAGAVWEFERKQLAEIANTISAVYASMGVIV